MKTARQIAEEIVNREGGFVDDPHDPGGATNFGVTIGTLRRLGLDVNKDGKIDQTDVAKLTRRQAVDIFLRHYYEQPGIAALPKALRASVFDMQVNSGANAVKILQQLLCQMGQEISVDGKIGPNTIAAAETAVALAPDHIVDAYGIARRNFYFKLADARPASRKYARTRAGNKGGWIIRAEAFISRRYHLSQDEFSKRTSAWG
ncbi:holin-associated N-acetylmuramidase [Cognatishimia sp. WU-CL00825]|uniref:holin-associated N-acetylmuramidase n=1 Tax=Cognatishimia sp. WU-CL00825 TaxID=3127658 RepID=UPI00310AE27F